MTRWSLAAVEKAAPDTASLTAARKLAGPGSWSDTGSTDALVWGKCQGSGKAPYQVSIDLTAPAYRCSCPSRKFPCKHALALLLRWVQGDGSVSEADRPADFAADWTQSRAERGTPGTSLKAQVDPEARARRQAERFETMSSGLDDLELWLGDLVRGGTAQARRQPWSWWDAAAARLVDAQLPGLAERVRTTGSDVVRRDDWADHLLGELGAWWSVVRAWKSWGRLDEQTRADLRAYVGWAQASEDVRTGPGVTDSWLVLGAHRSDDGRLQQQRTWLRGETSGHDVQLLDFAAGSTPLPLAHLAGSVLQATLALYPGSAPRRALVVDEPTVVTTVSPSVDSTVSLPTGGSLDDAFASLAHAWADNPWCVRVPVVVTGASLRPEAGGIVVTDVTGTCVPMLADSVPWAALALSGGAPTTLVGELESTGFRLLSVLADHGLVAT